MERLFAKPAVKRSIQILCVLVGINLLYAMVGFFAVPATIKALAPPKLSELLHRRFTIQDVQFNPYRLTLRLKGIQVDSPDSGETLASVGELFVNLEAPSFIRQSLILDELTVASPYFNLVRNEDGTLNIEDLLHTNQSSAASGGEKKEPSDKSGFVFIVKNISISGGSADILDRETNTAHRIDDLNVSIPFVSDYRSHIDFWTEPVIMATVNGAMVYLDAKLKPFSPCLNTTAHAELGRVDLLSYLSYLPPEIRLQVLSGEIDLDSRLAYARDDAGQDDAHVAGTVSVKRFESRHEDGSPLLRFSNLEATLDDLDPIQRSAHVSKISLDQPDVTVARKKDGRISLASIYQAKAEQRAPTAQTLPPEAEGESTPFAFAVDEIDLARGAVHFTDGKSHQPFQARLDDLYLTVCGISSANDARPNFDLAALSDQHERLSATGEVEMASLVTTGTLDVQDLKITRYAPYYADALRFDLKEGTLGLKTDFRIAPGKTEPDVQLTKLSLDLHNLGAIREGDPEDFFDLPRLAIREGSFDLRRKLVELKNIEGEQGKIFLRREPDGTINLLKLTPAGEVASATPQPAPQQDTDPSAADRPAPVSESRSPSNPWKVVLASSALKQFTVRVEDQAAREPLALTVDTIDLSLKDFSLGTADSSGKRSTLGLSLRLNGEGTASVQGDFGIDPLAAVLKVNLANIDLTPCRAYIPERIRVRLNGGKLSADGTLTLGTSENAGGVAVEYSGNGLLSDLAAVNTETEQALIGWKSLDLQNMRVTTTPLLVHIEKAALKDLESRIAISPQRTINVLELVAPEQPSTGSAPSAAATPATPPAPSPASAAAASSDPAPRKQATKPRQRKGSSTVVPAPPAPSTASPAPGTPPAGSTAEPSVLVQQILFENGAIDFSDESIQPAIRAQMAEIHGTITGLSSDKNAKADIQLKGSVDKHSPLEITGKLSPFADDLFAEVKLSFKNFDLTRLNPYAKKYAGYNLEKGALSLDLTYLIAKQRLDSKNSIFLDQLTFGDKVDSPDAVGLPVRFAVSLLQDRSGGIRLEIPVQGRLDNPQFSISSVIWKALSNLILKAVTAPFAFLGGLFGGGSGQDLGHVEFDPGSAALSGAALKKLETVAKILYERPGLQIDLEGHADKERDRERLRQNQLQEIITAQKAKEPQKKGAPPTEGGAIPAAEQESLLRKAFAEQTGTSKLAEKLSLDAIKSQLLEKLPVDDEALKSLAYQRAVNVRDHLEKVGKVDVKRIFLVDPKLDEPGSDKKKPSTRVVMQLK